MNAFNFVGAVLVLLGIIYAVMGLIALSHVDASKKTNKARMLFPAWYSHSEIYDDFGKRLCVAGRPLFFVVWIGFLAWFIAKEAM